jgi:hypothetical protein
MVIRALTSLRAELSQGRTEPKAEPAAKPEAKIEWPPEAEKPGPRKSRPKKSSSLNAWPEQENDEEVETFNLGKKS